MYKRQTEERVNKLYVLEGSKPIEVPELFAGDILSLIHICHAPSNLTPENYENADSMLPVEEGVTYQQCSLDPEGKQKLIYTQDGKRVYYTEDDGKSFEEIY